MNWKLWFPFDKVRPDQEASLNFIAEAWKEKDTVVLQLPTGVGKSGIAKTASLIAGSMVSDSQLVDHIKDWQGVIQSPKKDDVLNNTSTGKESSWLITPQKILQAQYVRDFPDIASIENKAGYKCLAYDKKKSCADGYELQKLVNGLDLTDPDILVKFAKDRETLKVIKRLKEQGDTSLPCGSPTCTYKAAFIEWISGKISLTNTSFFLSFSRTGQLLPRKCLIVDEAHQIEDDLVSFYSTTLSRLAIFEKYELKVPSFEEFSQLREWVEEELIPAVSEREAILETRFLVESSAPHVDMNKISNIRREIEETKRFFDKCSRVSDYDDTEWVLKEDDEGNQVAEPLHSGVIGSDYLLGFGVKKLFMSGTILDKKLFCRTVGLDPKNVAYFERDSPFLPERRTVFLDICGSMSRKSIDVTFPMMTDRIKEILEDHKEEKGIIHTGSYKIAEDLKKAVKNRRLLFHTNAQEREYILETHYTTNEPTVLVSPSMSTGVDLIGSLATFGIVMKIPWPYLGDKRIARLKDENSNWYSWRAIQHLLQQCGRIVRSMDDDTLMYILDSDILNIIRYNGDFLPDWWLKGLMFNEDAANQLNIT